MKSILELLSSWIKPEPFKSVFTIRGHIHAELRGPDGELKGVWDEHNLITDIGDQLYTKLVYGGLTIPTYRMKLGTATTAASKNGAGSFVATGDYITGSAASMVSTYPKVGASANIAQFQCLWAAGTATNATINRVGLVDNATDAGEADATHTFATGVFSGAVNKGAGDTLTVTWTWTGLGA